MKQKMRIFYSFLKQTDALADTVGYRFGIPDGALHLSDVDLFKDDHTNTGLSDTAAHAQGQMIL